MKLKTGKTSGNNKHFGMLTCVNSILGSLPLKYQMQPQNFVHILIILVNTTAHEQCICKLLQMKS